MKPRGSGEGDYDLSPTRQYTVVSKMPKGRRKNAALFLANSCFIFIFFKDTQHDHLSVLNSSFRFFLVC